jgi:glycosidase
MKYLPVLLPLLAMFLIFACGKKNAETPDGNVQKTTEAGGPDVDAEKKALEPLVPKYALREPLPQKVEKPRIEPLFWWVGMADPSLELIIHDNLIGDAKVDIQYPGLAVAKVSGTENPNYLFVELNIGKNAKAGTFPIRLTMNDGQTKEYTYELKNRERAQGRIQGLSPKDAVYLAMPDRFAQGDPANDVVEGMNQATVDRSKVLQRHGGDLQGIIDHLDYLADLGVTALWLNPVLENDEPYESYHGYAVTDNYLIDRRFGTNELYKKMVDECHKRGIKVVKDIVQNHVGHEHWFIKDLPSKDWIHQWDEFTRTTYRATTLHDPYGAADDIKRMDGGWFDYHMPDLNQNNPHVANYLTQYTIWWIEYTGLDALRIDTYAYPNLDYTRSWIARLKAEFPTLGLFGEVWDHGIVVQDFFVKKTGIYGITDFQMNYAINEALNNEQGWTSGVTKIYYTLAQDIVYDRPEMNVVFLDNHDLSRLATNVGGDINKIKSGISLLLTTRGIPCLYYGTELMMAGSGGGFGEGGRQDFPGGWAGDNPDKFKKEGRTPQEQEVFDCTQKLLQYRKNNPTLTEGKLMQFVPEDGVYVYFRYDGKKTVMVAFNSNNADKEVATKRYAERMQGFAKAQNIVTGESLSSLDKLQIKKNSTLVLELQP